MSEQHLPFTVFVDPNYDPLASYQSLESWLLVYDTIFVSSPSSTQAEKVNRIISGDAFKTLVDSGWLVPVGRPRFFDRQWRTGRAEDLAKTDEVRAAHFRWNDDFDSAIAGKARHLPDAELDNAIDAALDLEQRYPAAFSKLQEAVGRLRADQKLPAKFYAPSELGKPLEDTTRGVIYEVAGDLWARRFLGTTGLIAPAEQEGIYGLLDRAADGDWSPLQARIGAARGSAVGGLGEQDVRLARELSERIANRYTISAVLPEYRASALQREFRAFVLEALEDGRLHAERGANSDFLWQRFQDRIKGLDRQSEYGKAIGAMIGAMGGPEIASRLGLDKLPLSRRLFMRASLSLGALGGAALFGAMPRAASELFDAPDRWITLIHQKAALR